MKKIGTLIAAVLGLLLLVVVGIFGVSEAGGEVVTLETIDESGDRLLTRLWVVDDEGYAWLRSGQPTSGWFVRLEKTSHVEVTRNGEVASFLAEPVRDPETRDRIHELMLEKYGWAEQLISRMRDENDSIPVRLIPEPVT